MRGSSIDVDSLVVFVMLKNVDFLRSAGARLFVRSECVLDVDVEGLP